MAEGPEYLLAKIRRAPACSSRRELETLYLGFGFTIRHGANHDVVSHSQFPELRGTIARHQSLAIGYFTTAVKLIDKLKELRAQSVGE